MLQIHFALQIHHEHLNLPLLHPFTLGNGSSRNHTAITLLTLKDHAGNVAYGEAAMPPYLSETHETASHFLQKVMVNKLLEFGEAVELQHYLNQIDQDNTATKAAIDMAWHSLKAQQENCSLSELMGSVLLNPKASTFTIGIAKPQLIEQKLSEGLAFGFQRIKAKLGGNNDKEMIDTIRQHCSLPLFVDVNQGWKDKEAALDMIYYLQEKQVLFVEQPFAKTDFRAQDWLVQRSPLPIFADEACQSIQDLETLKNLYHGVNVKLMKCGGLHTALELQTKAKQYGLQTMIGCMTETSCATFAACSIAPLFDFVDLDGPWILANQPFERPVINNGIIEISNLDKK